MLDEPEEEEVEIEALARSVVSDFENYVKLNKKISPEVVGAASQIDDYSKLADTVASHLAIKIPEKQEMLGTLSVKERLEKAMGFMEAEISVLQVEKRIRSRVKRQMEKTQREYYLNEQMKAIQKELGEGEDGRDEAAEIEERIKKTKLSKEAREKAEAELKKLQIDVADVGRSRPSCATISTGCCRCPGARTPRSSRTSTSRRRCSTPTTTASTRSRTASSNISPCRAARRS